MAPGDWVCYGCLDWGPRLFHPEDLALKERMLARGEVCQVERQEGGFRVLRFGELRVRLRADLVGGRVILPPVFRLGAQVRVKPPRTERVGHVRRIGWHHDRRAHLFWIEQGGKRVKNRYFAEELERFRV
jgi:hypothetical protein